jgi:hypothetical protein
MKKIIEGGSTLIERKGIGVGSDQGKFLSLWGNSEKKTFFLTLEWLFSGRNRSNKGF